MLSSSRTRKTPHKRLSSDEKGHQSVALFLFRLVDQSSSYQLSPMISALD
jgi:hypothetical protein